MRWTVACVSAGALVCVASAGCERAETPTASEPAPGRQSAAPEQAAQGASVFVVTLSGAEEVPGPGDADGAGTARITLDPQKGELCYELSVENVDAANAVHVHSGAAGVSGPPVVPLEAPAEGTVQGCAPADAQVLLDIQQNPGNFYVNVHNAEFPQGAVRGQLQP